MGTGEAKGTLYLCATPIGNLKDITLRVLETIQQSEIIVCEDTRRTLKLLNHYRVKPSRLVSYHEFSPRRRLNELLELLSSGKNLVLVSDAGMPVISDPGYLLVREAWNRDIKVIAVPGPSAITTALAVSGFPADRFYFWGFLNRSPGKRRKELEKLSGIEETVVIFESPHQILRTLSELHEMLGPRETVIARELTKKYEEVSRDTLSGHIKHFQQIPPRGELVLVLGRHDLEKNQADLNPESSLKEDLIKLTRAGIPPTQAVKAVSLLRDKPRNKIYSIYLDLK